MEGGMSAMLFEVLFYDGWGEMPAYFLVDVVEGETAEEALQNNLPQIIAAVREMFKLDESVTDEKICETLYLLHPEGLLPVRKYTHRQVP
jgi:hypothetical protein